MVGHLKLAHLDLQSLNSFVFRGLRHVQVRRIYLFILLLFDFLYKLFGEFYFVFLVIEHPRKRFGYHPAWNLCQHDEYRSC